MVVERKPNIEITAEIINRHDGIDGRHETSSMAFEPENNIPPVGEPPPERTVERWVPDSGCSQFMTPSADYVVNYRGSGGIVRIADSRVRAIEGIQILPMRFWSGKDCVRIILLNVACVPLLGNILLSMRTIANRGHKYIRGNDGRTLHPKTGRLFLVLRYKN